MEDEVSDADEERLVCRGSQFDGTDRFAMDRRAVHIGPDHAEHGQVVSLRIAGLDLQAATDPDRRQTDTRLQVEHETAPPWLVARPNALDGMEVLGMLASKNIDGHDTPFTGVIISKYHSCQPRLL